MNITILRATLADIEARINEAQACLDEFGTCFETWATLEAIRAQVRTALARALWEARAKTRARA